MGRSKAKSPSNNKVMVKQDPEEPRPPDDDESARGGRSTRPRRKATNAHIIRYLQTKNPGRLEEEDLRKALEASMEGCPDFGWPAEDTASCSSSDQSNAASASSNSSTGEGCNSANMGGCAAKHRRSFKTETAHTKRGLKSSSSFYAQHNYQNLCNCHIAQHDHHYHPYQNGHPQHSGSKHQAGPASNSSCPRYSVHNRYKPVGKKNIYNEADFFHDGIMQYITYELLKKGHIRDVNDLRINTDLSK